MAEQLERPEDAGKGPQGDAARWCAELEASKREEKDWYKDAEVAVETYRNDKYGLGENLKARVGRFNILWSNTETFAPALYSKTPKAVVTRRFRQKDPVAALAGQLLERSTAYMLDIEDFDRSMRLVRWDYLIPSRAVLWVRYEPTIGNDNAGVEQVAYERTFAEHVQWDDFRRGPGKTWPEVPWVARRHRFTRDQCVQKFGPKIGDEIPLTLLPKDWTQDRKPLPTDGIFLRAEIWEIWDKDTKTVIWLCPNYKEGPVLVEDDPLHLEQFFPCAEPAYSCRSSNSLVPLVLYSFYADQAQELDRVTVRISLITSALRARGAYDARFKQDLSQVFKADDNEYIPVQNVAATLDSGGLSAAIWSLPLADLVTALQALIEQRNQIRQIIYEITGLSDVIRGSSDASETATAQQIKAQYGGLRINDHRQEVQRFARDTIRLMGEIIAEKFQPETIMQMTGLSPQTTGQQPEMFVQAFGLLRDEKLRCFNLDIETDSMIAVDEQGDKESVIELLQGLGNYVQAMLPAVQSGLIPPEVNKQFFLTVARKFRLGTELEQAIDQFNPQQQGPSPEQLQQMQQQLEQQMQQVQQAQQQIAQEQQKVQAAAQKVQNDGIALEKTKNQIDLAHGKLQNDMQLFEGQKQNALMEIHIERTQLKADQEMAIAKVNGQAAKNQRQNNSQNRQ